MSFCIQEVDPAERKSGDNFGVIPQPAPSDQLLVEPPSSPGRSVRFTPNGIRHSSLALICTALGGGMLSVPYMVSLVGVIPGVLFLCLGAFSSYISIASLMECTALTDQKSYAKLLAHVAGNWANPTLDLMLLLYGAGSLTGYYVFLSDFAKDLIRYVDPHAPSWCQTRSVTIGFFFVILFPLCIVEKLDALRHITPVSICSLLYVSVVIAAKAYSNWNSNEGKPGYGDITWCIWSLHMFQAWAMCVFAFNCHLNVVPVATTLIRPTKARVTKVSCWVNSVQVMFYLLIAMTGYLSFLGNTDQDIINDFSPSDIFW